MKLLFNSRLKKLTYPYGCDHDKVVISVCDTEDNLKADRHISVTNQCGGNPWGEDTETKMCLMWKETLRSKWELTTESICNCPHLVAFEALA